jgi:hypothetical protein
MLSIAFVRIQNAWIRIDFGRLDPDPEGQNDPSKTEKNEENFMF